MEQIFRGHNCNMPRTLYGRKNVLSKSTGRSGTLFYKLGEALVGKWKEAKVHFPTWCHRRQARERSGWEWPCKDRRGAASFAGFTLCRVCHWSITLAGDSGNRSSKTCSSGSLRFSKAPRRQGQRVGTENSGSMLQSSDAALVCVKWDAYGNL